MISSVAVIGPTLGVGEPLKAHQGCLCVWTTSGPSKPAWVPCSVRLTGSGVTIWLIEASTDQKEVTLFAWTIRQDKIKRVTIKSRRGVCGEDKPEWLHFQSALCLEMLEESPLELLKNHVCNYSRPALKHKGIVYFVTLDTPSGYPPQSLVVRVTDTAAIDLQQAKLFSAPR